MITEKQLGQLKPANTTAASVYSPAVTVTSAIIKTVMIVNVTNLTAAYSIFQDDNGTTYDESTALAWKVQLDGNSHVQLDGFYPMNNASGNLAVQTDSANYLCFTCWGAEIS